MQIKLFGNADCQKCNALKLAFDQVGVGYDFIDAFADEHQALCDAEGVDEIPHVQIIGPSGRIVYQQAGDVQVDTLFKIAKLVERKG
ncbi:MAG: hypothetical protein HC888_00345 [Candidatus Competibacteraceae bacterium]|nr:hypothetical protein [Candidatus Competibacteraceae bacterium]